MPESKIEPMTMDGAYDSAMNTLGVPSVEESLISETPSPVEVPAAPELVSPEPKDEAMARAGKLDQEQALARVRAEMADLNVAKEHLDFIREIQGNPNLKEHILKFYQSQSQPGSTVPVVSAAQEEDDPLAKMEPEDRKVVDHIMRKVLAVVEERLAPIQNVTGNIAAEREVQKGQAELAQLNSQFPEWKEHVDPKTLAEAKSLRPDLPIASIYRVLAFDKVYSQSSRTKAVLQEKLGRTAAPESNNRPRQKLRPRVMSRDDAFDAALKRFPLLASGGR